MCLVSNDNGVALYLDVHDLQSKTAWLASSRRTRRGLTPRLLVVVARAEITRIESQAEPQPKISVHVGLRQTEQQGGLQSAVHASLSAAQRITNPQPREPLSRT